MQKHAAEHAVYALDYDDKSVGTFTVGVNCWTPYFKEEQWSESTQGKRCLYLGKLGILPSFQGKGLARACLKAVDDIALSLGCVAIRFDAVLDVPNLYPFYSACGFGFAPGQEDPQGRAGIITVTPHRSYPGGLSSTRCVS
jgi:GNAT superfamily N-acetyltransferase